MRGSASAIYEGRSPVPRASTATATREAPARFSSPAISLAVAPVVKISSTRITRRPSKSYPARSRKAPRTLANLSLDFNLACGNVLRQRTIIPRANRTRKCRARPSARISALFVPRANRRVQNMGTGATRSGRNAATSLPRRRYNNRPIAAESMSATFHTSRTAQTAGGQATRRRRNGDSTPNPRGPASRDTGCTAANRRRPRTARRRSSHSEVETGGPSRHRATALPNAISDSPPRTSNRFGRAWSP